MPFSVVRTLQWLLVYYLSLCLSVYLTTKGKRTRLKVKLYRGSSANLPVQDDDILVDDGPCCYLESISPV